MNFEYIRSKQKNGLKTQQIFHLNSVICHTISENYALIVRSLAVNLRNQGGGKLGLGRICFWPDIGYTYIWPDTGYWYECLYPITKYYSSKNKISAQTFHYNTIMVGLYVYMSVCLYVRQSVICMQCN